MRGTIAKKLRREANRVTATMPNVRYSIQNGTRVLWGCTREAYHALKKTYRAQSVRSIR